MRRIDDIAPRIFERSVPVPFSGCWVWLAGKNGAGYGSLTVRGRAIGAHRASFLAFKGVIPDGMDVHHTCNNRLCVNPEHLRAVTHSDNMKAQAPRKLRALCKQGHELAGDNLYLWGGVRMCRTCRRLADVRHKSKVRTNA